MLKVCCCPLQPPFSPRRVYVILRSGFMTSMASFLDISATVSAPESPADGPVEQLPAGRGTGRGRGRGRGAGRGRGRTANPQPLPPGSPEYPLHEWSITVGRRGADCPGFWLNRMADYMSAHCEAGGAAFEVGDCTSRLLYRFAANVRTCSKSGWANTSKIFFLCFGGNRAQSAVCSSRTTTPGRPCWDTFRRIMGKPLRAAHS